MLMKYFFQNSLQSETIAGYCGMMHLTKGENIYILVHTQNDLCQ